MSFLLTPNLVAIVSPKWHSEGFQDLFPPLLTSFLVRVCFGQGVHLVLSLSSALSKVLAEDDSFLSKFLQTFWSLGVPI